MKSEEKIVFLSSTFSTAFCVKNEKILWLNPCVRKIPFPSDLFLLLATSLIDTRKKHFRWAMTSHQLSSALGKLKARIARINYEESILVDPHQCVDWEYEARVTFRAISQCTRRKPGIENNHKLDAFVGQLQPTRAGEIRFILGAEWKRSSPDARLASLFAPIKASKWRRSKFHQASYKQIRFIKTRWCGSAYDALAGSRGAIIS